MKTMPLRILLFSAGALAAGIGASILVAPVWFHAGNGIELEPSASLLSEVRAPGAALLVLGALMIAGVFSSALRWVSTLIATLVFLSYGVARLASLGLDGVPAEGLVGAMVVELVLGALFAVALAKTRRSGSGHGRAAHALSQEAA